MEALEKSNLTIARILDLETQKSITQWPLSFEDLNLDKEHEPFFYPCIEWLASEGLIRVKSYSRTLGGYAGGVANSPILTSTGLSILGRKITGDAQTIHISEAITDVSSGQTSYSQSGDFLAACLATLQNLSAYDP